MIEKPVIQIQKTATTILGRWWTVDLEDPRRYGRLKVMERSKEEEETKTIEASV